MTLPNFAGQWTDDQFFTCVKLWRKGKHSGSQIGEVIGKGRSAVIGKMARLGIHKGERGPIPILRGVVTPEPVPPQPAPSPIADFTRLICPCNNHNPCQPGYGLCAGCLNKRHKPNPRASVFVSLVRSA